MQPTVTSDELNLVFKLVSAEDLSAAIEIESQGFPLDEAASLESFQFRQSAAGDLFLGAYAADSNTLLGYVCSTLSPDESLTHDSMSTHVPGASSVCVHSVCVSRSLRGRGVGLQLLREYVARLEERYRRTDVPVPYRRVLLITHAHLRSFYEKAGFEWVGPSRVVHGSLPWYEMRIVLGSDGV